jgi:hypothetical protein
MEAIELDLVKHEFFCPVTGKQIVFAEEPFEASAATVFCYLPSERSFEYASEWTIKKYDECLNKLSVDQYKYEAFEMLIGSETDNNKNLICYSITTKGRTCGLSSFTVHICIDMDYVSEEKIK